MGGKTKEKRKATSHQSVWTHVSVLQLRRERILDRKVTRDKEPRRERQQGTEWEAGVCKVSCGMEFSRAGIGRIQDLSLGQAQGLVYVLCVVCAHAHVHVEAQGEHQASSIALRLKH